MVGPIYGQEVGLRPGEIGTFLAAFVLGGAIVQYPAGWLADKYPHRRVLIGCALVTALGMLMLPSTMGTVWMWPLLVAR